MLLFLLSLTGIPPTAGFAAKFVVIMSAVRADYIALAVLAVVCSVVSAFVYLRVAVLMYMKEPPESSTAKLGYTERSSSLISQIASNGFCQVST